MLWSKTDLWTRRHALLTEQQYVFTYTLGWPVTPYRSGYCKQWHWHRRQDLEPDLEHFLGPEELYRWHLVQHQRSHWYSHHCLQFCS